MVINLYFLINVVYFLYTTSQNIDIDECIYNLNDISNSNVKNKKQNTWSNGLRL